VINPAIDLFREAVVTSLAASTPRSLLPPSSLLLPVEPQTSPSCLPHHAAPLQVTNPAIDPFREAVVTSLRCFIGPEGDITTTVPQHARRLELAQPILSLKEMGAMKVMNIRTTKWKTKVGPHDCYDTYIKMTMHSIL
jgi:hypothetical protein